MNNKIFEGKEIALLTKHQKEKVIKPLMEYHTGAIVNLLDFDTDLFGTFTRDIERKGSQYDAARLKLRKALEISKDQIVMVSEGSFGPHPYLPVVWNVEIVLLFDRVNSTEISGVYQSGKTNMNHEIVSNLEELMIFANSIGFPQHFLVLRPDNEFSKDFIKNISNNIDLENAFYKCLNKSKTQKVFVETDMRAHANPTRMENIEKATLDLIKNISQLCPVCGSPGFTITDVQKGLPCEMCGLPTQIAKENVSKCQVCSHIEFQHFPNGEKASAQYCNYCNP